MSSTLVQCRDKADVSQNTARHVHNVFQVQRRRTNERVREKVELHDLFGRLVPIETTHAVIHVLGFSFLNGTIDLHKCTTILVKLSNDVSCAKMRNKV